MKNWLRTALLAAFYGLWFLVFTWPLGAHFTTAMLAEPGSDAGLFAWNVWHFDQAVAAGTNPFFTTWMFFPHGWSRHGDWPASGAIIGPTSCRRTSSIPSTFRYRSLGQ